MTLLVAIIASVVPSATIWENPCDRACRRAKAEARAESRWIRFRRRYTAPYRGWLASVRACESGGNYGIATGNGYYGAYQFSLSTWYAVGGHGYPHQNPPLEQDYRAVRLLKIGGPGHWPVCGS